MIRRTVVSLLIVCGAGFLAQSARAAYEFYIAVEGASQGDFRGEAPRANRADQQVGLAYHHEIRSPRDPATGQATGRRQHGPITITKQWGGASPQFLQALATNELLPTVVFEFESVAPDGVLQVSQRITLTDAVVTNIRLRGGAANSRPEDSERNLEDITLAYRAIQYESVAAGTVFQDDPFANP